MASHAYALKENAPEGLSIVVGYNNGETFHITDRIEEGGGVLVTDNPQELEILKDNAHVKRVSLEEAEKSYKPRRGGAGPKSQAAGTKDED